MMIIERFMIIIILISEDILLKKNIKINTKRTVLNELLHD